MKDYSSVLVLMLEQIKQILEKMHQEERTIYLETVIPDGSVKK